MPTADVMQLRALLSEKFPGLRMRLDEPRVADHQFYPTGLPQIDESLQGGLPKGALTEIIIPSGASGSCSTLIRRLVQQAAVGNEIIVLIDGNDSFEVTQFHQSILSRLLWIRCRAVAETVKAADLILRDANLPLVLLDLGINAENQIRKISPATWYRFQRLVEETGATCVVFTPRHMVASAKARLTLRAQFSITALNGDDEALLGGLKMDVWSQRDHCQTEFSLDQKQA